LRGGRNSRGGICWSDELKGVHRKSLPR